MRIGVDACCWSNRRGFGRFTRELLSAMAARGDGHSYIYFSDQQTATTAAFPEGVEVVVADTTVAATDAASAEGRRSLRDLLALTQAVHRTDLDVFFFPAVYSYFPIIPGPPLVVTIHDVIADHYPEATFPNKRLKYFWKAKQRLALLQSDTVLTVSEASKEAICDYFSLPEQRVAVTTEAASADFESISEGPDPEVLARYGLTPQDRFVLYVGGISPHKNLGTLVQAMAELGRDPASADVSLVLVGDYSGDVFHTDYPRLKRQVDGLERPDRVRFAGYVPDADLVHLYNGAAMLAFPSLEEGFGLPAVEAMQCGTPVIASDRGSLPEIVGEAGLLFDPLDAVAIRDVMSRVLNDAGVRERMRREGLARARRFTWDEAARRTVEVLEAAG